MENSNTYKIRPAIFTTVMVLLVSILLSGIFPTLSSFPNEAFKKTLTEKLVKNTGADRENSEEKEFSGEVLFSPEYRTTKFSKISNRISVNRFTFLVPQVSLDIPVPPPKKHTS